jgi:hypothetical protein
MCRVDNLTAISELIVQTMWDPQHLTTLLPPTVCYGDSFTFTFYMAVTIRIIAVKDKTLCTLVRHYQHSGVKTIHSAEYSS